MIPREVLAEIAARQEAYVEELADFLRIPSVSTAAAHAADVRRAARWVLAKLQRLGFEAALHETDRHPLVYARRLAGEALPTLLIYGHYDVQPPEPLEDWVTPPFSPSTREGFIYARGATDNKGQCFTYLAAAEAVLALYGALPINVKILLEGEEEIGSPGLSPFLQEHLQELQSDAIAISDGSQFAAGIPAITYGLRGLAYLQIEVQGARFDLHSGGFGGMVANPLQLLCEMLARLKNRDGTIAIPGFYDEVLPLQAWERKEMAGLPFDEARLKEYLGLDELEGEAGYSPIERKTARPSLDINGLWGGFSGEGAKTIIPARGGAKISMRLVPNQRATKINRLFKEFVRSLAPEGIKVEITELHGSDPVLLDRQQPAMGAAARAIEIGFGKKPVFVREGGSIPVVPLFKEVLGCNNILLMGWGRPDDGAHSPNERFSLEDFHRGCRAAAALFYELAP